MAKTVREVMTSKLCSIDTDKTVAYAAKMMRDEDVGSLPVAEGNRLVGMITDRDITVRSTAQGADPSAAQVRDAMTADVTYCFEDDDVTQAAALMRQKQLRRLVVLNRDKRLVGIVALGDLATDTRDDRLAGKTLGAVSEPSEPKS